MPSDGSTIKSPSSYAVPVSSYSDESYNPAPLTPSTPPVSKAVPGVKVLLKANAIGCPGVSISNLYVCPLYNFKLGFLVNPFGENTYAKLSSSSSSVTV